MATARDWMIEGAPGATTSPEVFAGACERLIADGVPISRAEAYVRTSELAPQSDELRFWAGLAIAQQGDVAAGADAVRRAAAAHPGWLTLLERLSPEFAPAGEAVRKALSARPAAWPG